MSKAAFCQIIRDKCQYYDTIIIIIIIITIIVITTTTIMPVWQYIAL